MSYNFSINMISSKDKYHQAGILSARTFKKFLKDIDVNIYIPKTETLSKELQKDADLYNINIKYFNFDNNPNLRYTTQLKPQGFVKILENLPSNQFAFIVDSDTYCIRKFCIPDKTQKSLENGKIIFTKEPWNRYESMHGDKNRPDYIPPEKRLEYINSGVIIASKNNLDIFSKILELSTTKDFSPLPTPIPCPL